MIIYEASVKDFIETAKDSHKLVSEIAYNLKTKFGISVRENEQRSWAASLPNVAKLLKTSSEDSRTVLCEFNIPTSKRRIDFIILGKNKQGKPSAMVLELKQWSDVTEIEWNMFRVGQYTDSHPSDQAKQYKFDLDERMGMVDKVDIKAASYLHNLTNEKSPLFNKGSYGDILKVFKLYSGLDEAELSQVIDEHTAVRDGAASLEVFKDVNWKPSKSFQEIVKENFKTITLSGSQQLIFDRIEKFVKTWNKEDKMTFLISGDPGSGKTVIAFKLMNLIVSELGINMQMMIPGQEVRNAFKASLGKNVLANNISGATMWRGYESVIIDEAHKAVSRDWGEINYDRNYKKIKFAIVFIDDDQVVNKKGMTKAMVKDIAEKHGHVVHEYRIEENFRSLGERALLDWIDSTFYMRNTINGEFEYRHEMYVNANQKYKLYGYKNADDFVKAYHEHSSSKESTRITSLWHKGYYIGPADENGEPKPSFSIGSTDFIWNPNTEWKNNVIKANPDFWSTYNKNVKRVANDRKLFLTEKPKGNYAAYFNHIQGYEFDNIFVYIPKIFTFENGEIKFHADKIAGEVSKSQIWANNTKSDRLVGGTPYELNKRYFLNRIKVMLTRGTKSTHVFAEDKALNDYIHSKIS